MPRLLAFDTSTETLAVALCLPGQTLVHEGEGGALASMQLIPQIVALLAQGRCTLAQLDAIAFGRGPGAFTGLRTACSVAQGLALGAGKPVLSIDSLMLVAEGACADDPGAVTDGWVAMDARMDEIYAARYRRERDGLWQTLHAPCLIGVDALNSRWRAEPPAWVAGSALALFADRLQPAGARWVPQARSRAAALARLAVAAWDTGAAVDAALALPVYVRDKVAQTTAERDAARAAKALA